MLILLRFSIREGAGVELILILQACRIHNVLAGSSSMLLYCILHTSTLLRSSSFKIRSVNKVRVFVYLYYLLSYSYFIYPTQSWELAGHVRVSSTPNVAIKSSRSSRFVILIGPVNQFKHCELTCLILFNLSCSPSVLQRASPFLGCLPRLSRTHALFLSWRRYFSPNKSTWSH